MINKKSKGIKWGSMTPKERGGLSFLDPKCRIRLEKDGYVDVDEFNDSRASYWHKDLLNNEEGLKKKLKGKAFEFPTSTPENPRILKIGVPGLDNMTSRKLKLKMTKKEIAMITDSSVFWAGLREYP